MYKYYKLILSVNCVLYNLSSATKRPHLVDIPWGIYNVMAGIP